MQVVNILNIFLIGGDAILSQVGSYDDLCYEIIRNSTMINSAYAMGLRYSAVQSASTQAAAKKFLSAMTNLRAVMTHFIPKIEAFSAEYHKTTMERDEVWFSLNVDVQVCFRLGQGRDNSDGR